MKDDKKIITIEKSAVDDISFSSDSSKVITALADGTIKIWDANSCDLLETSEGYVGKVISIKRSNDGSKMIFKEKNGEVKVWNTNNGNCLLTLSADKEYYLFTLSPDGRKVAAKPLTNNAFGVSNTDIIEVFDLE